MSTEGNVLNAQPAAAEADVLIGTVLTGPPDEQDPFEAEQSEVNDGWLPLYRCGAPIERYGK